VAGEGEGAEESWEEGRNGKKEVIMIDAEAEGGEEIEERRRLGQG
jgi:hypothetical protein